MNLENICYGDLYELQKIPKIKFTELFSKELVEKMEKNIHDLLIKYNSISYNDTEIKIAACSLLENIKRIEKCILYIKKIK
jgi:hypothetical protein